MEISISNPKETSVYYMMCPYSASISDKEQNPAMTESIRVT
jgi:hypothetical protein